MKKKPREYDDDNGQTFADMNVDGMPWYDPARKNSPFAGSNHQERMNMSRSDRFNVMLGVLAAVGLVALVFAVVYFIAIFVMTLVWR